MSRYGREHYEEIALLLQRERTEWVGQLRLPVERLMQAFADLFAADNPDSVYCGYCGTKEDTTAPCDPNVNREHSFVYHKGFDRDKFLKACGLEPWNEAVEGLANAIEEMKR